jgi:hypothetical protein
MHEEISINVDLVKFPFKIAVCDSWNIPVIYAWNLAWNHIVFGNLSQSVPRGLKIEPISTITQWGSLRNKSDVYGICIKLHCKELFVFPSLLEEEKLSWGLPWIHSFKSLITILSGNNACIYERFRHVRWNWSIMDHLLLHTPLIGLYYAGRQSQQSFLLLSPSTHSLHVSASAGHFQVNLFFEASYCLLTVPLFWLFLHI